MRALIADDDRIVTTMVSRVLSKWDLDTGVAHDGLAAWAALTADPVPSLAIVDWDMPGMSGLEICGRIRSEPSRAHIYVLFLTARDNRRDLIAALDAGADDYLAKPFDLDELRARVQVGLRVVTLQERLAEQVKELQASLSNVKRLRGLLPICSYCKRIRNDHDYWERVESYVMDHTDATFTHGICPDCLPAVRSKFGL